MSGHGKNGGKPRRNRHLSDDDAALWSAVAETTQPIAAKRRVPARGGVAEAETASATLPVPPVPRPAPAKPSRKQATAAAKALPPVAPPPRAVPPKRPPPMADFDRRTARRIASGRVEIDARLDLHGERQSAAHSLLRAFLMRAQAAGKRTVLVITGKGARDRDDDPARMLVDGDRRGVLKRSVPQWLGDPDLRGVVLSFTTAHARHGGEGALYVHLRRGGS